MWGNFFAHALFEGKNGFEVLMEVRVNQKWWLQQLKLGIILDKRNALSQQQAEHLHGIVIELNQ